MQSNRPDSKSTADQECAYKKWLLGIITAIIVSPLIILATPYLFQTSTIYHFLLHLASVTMAVFLTTVALDSFRTSKDSRVLLTALGFVVLIVVEVLLLLNTAELTASIALPVVNIEMSHLLLFGMLVLFAIGVLKVNRESRTSQQN